MTPAPVSREYDYAVVRGFAISALVWGTLGMLAGLLAAAQLAWPAANLGLPWTTFGRIRPLHTNAVIFGFTLSSVFASVYYSTQRLCRVRMFSDRLSRIHLVLYNVTIALGGASLLAGMSSSKEYAELEWPIDILVVIMWLVFAVNFFGTLAKRREKPMYVSLWFYIATVITIALLYVFNNLELPVSWTKSYSVYAGVNDANVQWWYGHNAVAFVLTTPILGMMYYFVPKQSGNPVYSHRLSIVHFWSLIFLYIWAGPHHLIYTSLPDWAQTLGTAFSVMLILPSWGGMLNGFLTLKGSWHRLRTDPILKFLVLGITFYGMSTFEGPMMAVKSVNALTHYSNYTIGHVHGGALGWVAFTSFAALYYMVPRVWGTRLYSVRMAETHFWIAITGVILYVSSMDVSGVVQGLMWRAFNPDGSLTYTFIETVAAIHVYDVIRFVGGLFFITGLVLMIANLVLTIRSGRAAAPVGAAVPVRG